MKKRLSLLLVVTGLFLAGAIYTAKAGDEKCKAKTEKKCDSTKTEAKKSDKKCDGKKTETKKEESKPSDTEKK